MSDSSKAFHTTTVRAPLDLWEALDDVRALRARETGRRPLTGELILEALRSFVAQEAREAGH